MAEIRILDDKFKNIIKLADKSMDEFIESIKSEKKFGIELSGAKLVMNTWEIDLFLRRAIRKLVELRLNVHLKSNSGILLTAKEVEHLHRFQNFLKHLEQRRNEFLERNGQKFIISTATISHQFVQMPNIFLSPFV